MFYLKRPLSEQEIKGFKSIATSYQIKRDNKGNITSATFDFFPPIGLNYKNGRLNVVDLKEEFELPPRFLE